VIDDSRPTRPVQLLVSVTVQIEIAVGRPVERLMRHRQSLVPDGEDVRTVAPLEAQLLRPAEQRAPIAIAIAEYAEQGHPQPTELGQHELSYDVAAVNDPLNAKLVQLLDRLPHHSQVVVRIGDDSQPTHWSRSRSGSNRRSRTGWRSFFSALASI